MTESPLNPYQSPASKPDALPDDTGLFRSGELIMVRGDVTFPEICPLTGLPAEASWQRKSDQLLWIPTWGHLIWLMFAAPALIKHYFPDWNMLLLLVPYLVIFVVLFSLVKKQNISYPICPDLERSIQRNGMIAIFLGLAVPGLLGVLTPSPFKGAALLWIGGPAVIAAVVIGLRIPRLKVDRVRDGWFRVKGCAPDFLKALPEETQPESGGR